jgi:FMN phosphatase YigB (HAD superfamily)
LIHLRVSDILALIDEVNIFTPSDWDGIRLVAFDVDGTLYRQRPVQLKMARDLLIHSLFERDLNAAAVLANYRRIRERLADEQVVDFERVLITETAAATANSPHTVREIVSEWIEERPLPYLAGCLYRGLHQLFAGLRREGKSIGILSDYPGKAKLAALGLTADHVVSAGDEGIRVLKPHPRGLECLIDAAGVKARATMLIGDRVDRDGVVARRVGTQVLIRSSRPIAGWQTFAMFDGALFAPFFNP